MIAFDASGTSGSPSSSSPVTFTHVNTGSNLILLVGTRDTGDAITGVTYNGVAMTEIVGARSGSASVGYTKLWFLINPATGSHSVSISFSSGFAEGISVSYTGVKQSAQPDSSGASADANPDTSVTASSTVVNTNCWIIGLLGSGFNQNFAIGTGLTSLRVNSIAGPKGMGFADSNTEVSLGSYSTTWTTSVAEFMSSGQISLSPFDGSASASSSPSASASKSASSSLSPSSSGSSSASASSSSSGSASASASLSPSSSGSLSASPSVSSSVSASPSPARYVPKYTTFGSRNLD